MAKIAPVSGVPKTAPNPAAIPHISRVRVSIASSRRERARVLEMLPPIWTAVPSRPADPPNKCVATVPIKTSGAIRLGTPPPGSWISSIRRLLPPSTDWPTR